MNAIQGACQAPAWKLERDRRTAARDAGFYWVNLGADWEPAEWNGEKWFFAGDWKGVPDQRLKAIGPRLTPPAGELRVAHDQTTDVLAEARAAIARSRSRTVLDDYTADTLLVTVIRGCARPAGRACVGVRPRWSVVADLTLLGSTYAAQLCRWAGTDPNEMVVRSR
jgi:hypothetical protein